MFDPEAPPHDPLIARALGPVGRALAELVGAGARRILVACSGGADSVALLGLLVLLRRREGLELVVGHVDHGLRPESADEAAMVVALAERLGLEWRRARLSLERGAGLPARARTARRAALLEHARQLGAGTIALGHTATDQAETMLMHAIRGAGLDGLAAMPAHDLPWFRPLLGLTRAETRSLAERLELPFVDDPTNTDTDHLRVWLRTCMLPPLREHNPELERALAGLAEQARDAEDALDRWARREESERRRSESDPDTPTEPGRSSWSLADFHVLPRAIRTRTLRYMCSAAGVDLSELRRRTIAELERAAVAVAVAHERRASEPGHPSPAPRHWDLAPQRRVTIDRNGVHTGSGRPIDASRNH